MKGVIALTGKTTEDGTPATASPHATQGAGSVG